MSNHVLICLVLLMDGFSSLIFTYKDFPFGVGWINFMVMRIEDYFLSMVLICHKITQKWSTVYSSTCIEGHTFGLGLKGNFSCEKLLYNQFKLHYAPLEE
jgi:hypothetical protein